MMALLLLDERRMLAVLDHVALARSQRSLVSDSTGGGSLASSQVFRVQSASIGIEVLVRAILTHPRDHALMLRCYSLIS